MSIKNSFIDFHCMPQEKDGSVVDTFTHTLSLPNWHSDIDYPSSILLVFYNYPIVEWCKGLSTPPSH